MNQTGEQPPSPAIDDKRSNDGHDQYDPLLEALLIAVRSHGGNLTREAALAGLPLDGGRLSLDLFARAAQRGNLATRFVRKPLDKLNSNLFPVILLLENHHVCLLTGIDSKKKLARIIHPEFAESCSELPLDELNADYSGNAIYLQPKFRFDARNPVVGKVRRRHWFWSVLGDNMPLYRDVLVAAFLISLFALALPLFTRNVYDRVVPNQAVDTLWVLASGVMIILLGDLLLRTMRSYFLDLASKRVDVKL